MQDTTQSGAPAPAEPQPGDHELTPQEALEIAVRAHRSGDVAVAEAVYDRILAVLPDYADALHFSGILRHQTNRPRDAVRLIRRAIEIEPDDAGMHNNLGNVLFELDRPDLALQAYEMAIVLEPGHIDARNNLGVVLRALRRVDEAEAVYREAVDLEPRHREAWDNLGRLLSGRGRIKEAIACHVKALELEPANAGTRRFLVAAYAATDEKERALAILRKWLADEPNSASARHLIAAISGENVPERASDRYVEDLFNGFAASFDHKLARLDYRAPELVAAAVAALYPATGAGLAILDAGCGTGLCGPMLRPFAGHLVGVDLSGKMLEKAAQRGGYDALDRAELTQYFAAHPGAYDLIVSADTLCYFGPLETVLALAREALRPGGRFVFSVEAETGGEPYRLHSHGRYSHARGYVEQAAAAAGLRLEALEPAALRMERGEPVHGLIVTARVPAP
ncbi:Trans-aconitate 2-methyltransferase [Methylobacterium crusticola]|uniref:Trans-aconitate 2-methyltransferase n=1 Tax=Methylobacterium crusticola TaxID=1697972 RepID=A0ABQ4QW30_9HYPH|nr:tetratricopeptide repeat protein [Methylobacterium crusticola]GJD49561.1 Trans-aconitate 2-methyltransferase [Methylobacterium crusticola]